MVAKKKPAAKPRAAAKPKAAPAAKPAVKGPTTKSGTLSAADRKPEAAPKTISAKDMEKAVQRHKDAVAKGDPLAVAAEEHLAALRAGPGLVEHGVGVGRHRPEDGPVAASGTVILVAPERGAQ